MQTKTVVGLITAALAATACAYTVYDGGKALHQNILSGTPVGANGETYTDANGGKWQYLRANDNLATSTVAFGSSVASGTYYRGIGGTAPRSGSPFIHVNVSGAATRDGVTDGPTATAEPIDADEFYVHPGNADAANHFVVLRFVVPEAGWYSAFLTAHDVNGAGSANNQAGAEIRLLANNVMQARSVVRLEDYEGGSSVYLLTRRFYFQMPVRWMTAGETIDFMVGANGVHQSDATGLKAFVTKEDEGAFYDSGLALNANISGSSFNPFGTREHGTWYCFSADTTAPRDSAGAAKSCPADFFATWAPGRLTKKLNLLDSSATRTDPPLLKGFFMSSRIGTSPFICVNQTSASAGDVAPQELYTHPHGTNWTDWTALRFRPPRGGLYSASVVLRDVARNMNVSDADGVMAYLLVGEKVVTNAVVCAETLVSSAHFTFDARFVAANEPIDIVVSPHNGHSSDATTISAIFRREADAYDAGFSLAELAKANGGAPSRPFADACGGGATWDVGQSSSASGTFSQMPYDFLKVNNGIDFFGYGAAADGGLPRVMISTNGVAQNYNSSDPKKYRMAPCELWAHPNNSGLACPVVRATVPADGIYHARAQARDISAGGNGIRLNLSAGGFLPGTKPLSYDGDTVETGVDGDRLWLKAGAALDTLIDPVSGNHTSDGTCLSACYIKVGDAVPRVVNVDFTGAPDPAGRFSAHTEAGREGWSDWNKWNALRPGAAAEAACRCCFEADGTTRRNATVTLTRDSGAAVATVAGSGATALLNNYVSSDDANDSYTFTISELEKNAPYTLWLYSAKGSATGNAAFTVGGATKGVEETWSLSTTKMLTRFDVTSDANGVITGSFAAADGNGGAFNGLTLVGDLPAFVATGTMVMVR